MKLINKRVDKFGAGHVKLTVEDTEDIWHLYNLIAVGDSVRATTVRKVQTESDTGSSSNTRIRLMLTLAVESTDVDTDASMLRIAGRNTEENAHVKMGAYHTIDVQINNTLSIRKAEWDSLAFERITLACDPAQSLDLAAVLMQDGLAHVCLIKSSMTLVRCKIEMSIPRKRRGLTGQHDKGMQRFYDAVLQAIVRHIDFTVVKCVLLASPGFVKDQFFAYLTTKCSELKVLADNRSKFVLVHSSSGYTNAMAEILQDPAVVDRVSSTMAVGEVKALQRFYETLQMDSARAFYGTAHVLQAAEADAIETLLISDNLFRSPNVNIRKQYVKLVESVRSSGGEVKIFSSMHPSGEQLSQLTGVAALLRFPMAELEDSIQDDVDNDSDDER